MLYTPDEIMVVCIARQIRDGEMVVQGLATPLIAAAYLLARRTHAPHLYFASAIGQSLCREPAPLGLSRVESLWLDRALTSVSFVRVVTEILPRLRPLEFFRPAQVDSAGNFNNVAFGKGYVEQPAAKRRPRLRLPGSGGIPDVTTFIDDISLYVPRHSRATFVPTLDVISGLGHHPARTHGKGPVSLISNLGQFDFAGTVPGEDAASPTPRRRMRLLTYHLGSSIEQILAHTGFELEIAPGAGQTPEPAAEEIRILREEIDPLGIRRLEAMSGAARHQLLREILKMEK